MNSTKERETITCERCSGTGIAVWGAIVNGVPTHSGTCYRCQGKGKQVDADQRRNWGYDNFGQSIGWARPNEEDRSASTVPAVEPVRRPAAPKVAVGDGRYALECNGDWKFYTVNTPTEGKWKGFTFVSRMASEERYPVKNREERTQILAAIAADPLQAMRAYGIHIGKCGHCNRTLTNAESRVYGIGPICREQMGY